MSRLKADSLLLITAVIWGTAFIAQKTGMDGIGPLSFIGSRFTLSFLVILPLCLREAARSQGRRLTRRDRWLGVALCASFFPAVYLQQAGLLTTSVTNAGFLTGLYVVMVPFMYWALFRERPAWLIWPASITALLGVWLLNGAALSSFSAGDWMVLASAVFFAVHVALIGLVVSRTRRPLLFSVIQYAACATCAWTGAALFENPDASALARNWIPIAYAGLMSGGIAYTLQAVAQQHSPPSDAAIILSGEAVFAALAGYLLLHERLDALGVTGCVLIMGAIVGVELGAACRKTPDAQET